MPEKLQRMFHVAIAVLAGDAAFEFLHRADVFEQGDAAAIDADEVIVVPARVEQLEMAGGAAEMHALGETETFERAHHAENSREIGACAAFAVRGGFGLDFFQTQRTARTEQGAQDVATGSGDAQAVAAQGGEQRVERQRGGRPVFV